MLKSIIQNDGIKKTSLLLIGLGVLGATCVIASPEAAAQRSGDSLIVTNDPLPANVRQRVYSKPAQAPQTRPEQVTGASYFGDETETVVGKKVSTLRSELFALQGRVGDLAQNLSSLEQQGQQHAAEYYASVATISTQLQAGTTPGNPRLVSRLTTARDNLEKLAGNVAALNDISVEISDSASLASFLLNNARATYSLSGGIEEDHVRLAELEDTINKVVIIIERLSTNVMDDVARTTAYLNTERESLRTLSLAITTGHMFRRNLSSMVFDPANAAIIGYENSPGYIQASTGMHPAMPVPPMVPAPSSATMNLAPTSGLMPGSAAAMQPGGMNAMPMQANPRPLVKIRFNKPDVSYEQPLYQAVNQALSRFPGARFELVAVHPGTGNAATSAIESTKARRNAEKVLRSLGQMGLSLNRVDLSFAPSTLAETSEVHLYVR